MSNPVALRPTGGTGLISREDLAKSLNNAAMSMPSVGGDKAFLKMDKNNGDWLFGQEETVVEDTSLWAANPMSIKHGWVAWDSNAAGPPVQEVMVPINRVKPALDSLPALPMSSPNKKTGQTYQLVYQPQCSVDLTCINGEDEGTVVEYKQSSTGAMKLFGSLINSLLDQTEKGDAIVAVGHLKADPYKHKSYGRIFNPIFEIVEWRTMDDTSEPVAEEPKQEAPAEPARARTRPATDAEVRSGQPSTTADADADEEARLAAEYEAEQAAAAANPTPRRRVRR